MKAIILTITIVATSIIRANAQPGLLTPAFNTNDLGLGQCDGPNGPVNATLTTADGKTIVVGNFSTFNAYTANKIVKLKDDGAVDSTFLIGSGVNGNISKIKLYNNQQVIISGQFTAVNGITRNQMARLNIDGTLDPSFSTGIGFNGSVEDFAIQSDGKILVVGNFTTVNGVSKNRIIRLNTDGSIDNSFNIGTGANYILNSVIIQNDNKILIGGLFTSYNGVNKLSVARLNIDGSIDNTFDSGSGANGLGYAIECLDIQNDGKIIAVGPFLNFNGVLRNKIVRLNSDGSVDLLFNPGTGVTSSSSSFISFVKVLNDNQIIFSGQFSSYDNSLRKSIAICDSLGSLDGSFNANILGTTPQVYSVEVLPNNDFIISGSFNRILNFGRNNIAKINTYGELDESFLEAHGANSWVLQIEKDNNNKLLIGGIFRIYNNKYSPRIMRINLDGSVDETFNPEDGPNNTVGVVCVQVDNKILIGGAFDSVSHVSRKSIARLNQDGTLDNTFTVGSGLNNGISAIKVQNDGKILLGGHFTLYNGTTVNRIVRLNTDGSIDPTFNTGTGFNAEVLAMDLQADGKIIIGGNFTNFNSTTVNRIIRLNSDGSVDPTFSVTSGANQPVRKILVQPDGKIIVGGDFSSIGGTTKYGLARLNTNGQVESSFNPIPGISGSIEDIEIQDDGKIVVVGSISQSSSNISITRLNSNGVIDPSFDNNIGPVGVGAGASNAIKTICIGSNNKLYLGGQFTKYDNQGKNRIACLNSCTYNISQTISACDSLTWINGVTYYISTSTPQHIISNLDGCDTVISLDLTILNNTGVDIQTACDSLTWIDGITYHSSTTTPTWTLTNTSGCDSIVTLNLTINNSTSGTDTQHTCDSLVWIDGLTYYSSTNTPSWTLTNVAGCDSVVTLNLTITPSTPTIIENTFSLPSDANNCLGQFAVDISGNGDFELDIDNGAQTTTSSGYNLFTGLCPGVHDLQIVNFCGDTTVSQFVIPVDSNYVFTNPFIDSLAQDSLGVTLEDCEIYYAGIDTAYIDSIWATGNTVNVIWNIVDSNGSNLDTTTYELNNGNGVYWLQLSVFCPTKALDDYFTVTEAIYFDDDVSTTGINDPSQNNLSVYPNPSNDMVTISFDGNEAELTVYDAQGKLIREREELQTGAQVSLHHLQTGVYFFHIISGGVKTVKRVIKS